MRCKTNFNEDETQYIQEQNSLNLQHCFHKQKKPMHSARCTVHAADKIRHTLERMHVCVFFCVSLTFKLNAEKNYNFCASCILREQKKKKKKT